MPDAVATAVARLSDEHFGGFAVQPRKRFRRLVRKPIGRERLRAEGAPNWRGLGTASLENNQR